MKKKMQIFFAHSAGSQNGKGEGSFDLVSYLRTMLGDNYNIHFPIVDEPDSPSYENWKKLLDRELIKFDEPVILIGHSLGASILLKYLSEEKCNLQTKGLFLVATPQWGSDGWNLAEFDFQTDFLKHLPQIPSLYFYHCISDPIVPFSHLDFYRKAFNKAIFRELSCKDHAFQNGLKELVVDIHRIAWNEHPSKL